MKCMITAIAILGMLLALALPTMAAPGDDALIQANSLHALGLLQGVGSDPQGSPLYELERVPTRVEGLVMLLRAMGKEAEIKGDIWESPFQDVPSWAQSYVGYAYETGLTKGLSAQQFGAAEPCSAANYFTFMLRALGYVDEGGRDFTWSDPYSMAELVGIFHYGVKIEDFRRGDAAMVTYAALTALCKGTETTLLASLVDCGAVAAGVAESSRLLKMGPDPSSDSFSLTQDDTFQTSGMVAWDGTNTYLLAKMNEKTPHGYDVYKIYHRDSVGKLTELYNTRESGLRLSDLSLHNGKLYFCANTSLAKNIVNPRYELVEFDPATQGYQVIYTARYFSQYWWYDNTFYVMLMTKDSEDINSERYAFARVDGKTSATPLIDNLTFSEMANFIAYGQHGKIFFSTVNNNYLRYLWTYDLATGNAAPVLKEKMGLGVFAGDELFYINFDSKEIRHTSLKNPAESKKILGLTDQEYGDFFLHRGALYFKDCSTNQLYKISPNGTRETVLRVPSINTKCGFFGDFVITPPAGILDSLGKDVSIWSLDDLVKMLYLEWLGEPVA